MERDPRRNNFNVQDQLDYPRMLVKPSELQNVNQTNNIDSLRVNRKDPTITNNTILELANSDQRSLVPSTDGCNPTIANTSPLPHQATRLLSFVSAPKVQLMPPNANTSPHDPNRTHEKIPHVMVMYTNVSVTPDFEINRSEAGNKMLQSVGFVPPTSSSVGDIGNANAGVRAVLSAMGGISAQTASAQHFPAQSVPPNTLAVSHQTSAVCSRPPEQFALSPGSDMGQFSQGRCTGISPWRFGSLDHSGFRDSSFRHVEPTQRVQRQDFGAESQRRHDEEQHQQLRNQFHLQQMNQYRQGHQAQQLQMNEQHKSQTHQEMKLSQNQADRQQNPRAINMHQERNGLQSSMRIGAGVAAATSLEKRMPHHQAIAGHGTAFRPESVPATPTTAATSSTLPFPTTPSSPDNNGSSSNGSTLKEYVCQHPGCTKTFDRRYNLTVHFRRHTDEMPYPCKVEGCPQRFKWRSSQSHHMKTRHQVASTGKGGRSNTTKNLSDKNTGGKIGVRPDQIPENRSPGFSEPSKTNDDQMTVFSSQHLPSSHGVQFHGTIQRPENNTFSPKKRARMDSQS